MYCIHSLYSFDSLNMFYLSYIGYIFELSLSFPDYCSLCLVSQCGIGYFKLLKQDMAKEERVNMVSFICSLLRKSKILGFNDTVLQPKPPAFITHSISSTNRPITAKHIPQGHISMSVKCFNF